MTREQEVQRFLDLIQKSHRGKFKVYIGMIAGVGKTYRMLQEAHELKDRGVDVLVGYIETHGREDTEALVAGLPILPRKKVFYKGKEVEEMDVEAIVLMHPEIVIIDELAHTNVEGSINEKRWQDVVYLLDEGINVISAVNIQHLEGLSEEIKAISGIHVAERIPDSLLEDADEVVNIDLTSQELIDRLEAGKIYKKDKVKIALEHFFKRENIMQLRELALKEVALRLEKKIEDEMPYNVRVRHEKFLAVISTDDHITRILIHRCARLAARYNTTFIALYVQSYSEDPDRIPLALQRHLINNFKLVTELGGEVVRINSSDIIGTVLEVCSEKQVTYLCMGMPHIPFWKWPIYWFPRRRLINGLRAKGIDFLMVSR